MCCEEFSANNALADFDSIDTANHVYLGFASEPKVNVFSHKYRGSKYSSTTQVLLDNLDLLKIDNPELVAGTVHLVQDTVSLDCATACLACSKTGKELGSNQWKYLSDYIGEVEKGFTRPPFLSSLYAFYYATAIQAQNKFPGEALLVERNKWLLATYDSSLNAVLESGKILNFESLYNFFDIVPTAVSVSTQRDIISNEVERFILQDYQRSEQFEVDLPLKHVASSSSNQYSRVSLLALPDPQSSLFKFFARNPMRYPGETEEQLYPCTYVHNSHNKGRSSEHVISVPPNTEYNLKGLSDLLEEMEDRSRDTASEEKRAQDTPRPGYAYNDPWYDERHSEYSILDNPKDGSRLDRSDVLEALWYFASPLNHVTAHQTTTSVFIPFWPGDIQAFIDHEMQGNNGWEPWSSNPKYLRDFLPYMERIFLQTNKPDKRLVAFKSMQGFDVRLAPAHVLDEGPTIGVVREKVLDRSYEILSQAQIDLRVFTYEYGLGLLEIKVDVNDSHVSLFDSQWLEYCMALTPADILLEGVINTVTLGLLSPNKHFACTSLTDFDYRGGCLRDGRSTGGAIQMMVSDAEPIFKNLPLGKKLVTDRTVVDETSKRFYFCSSTSLLNFDETASREEHDLAHTASSLVFNMVLAQRFILSESRQDIIKAEHQDSQYRRQLTFKRWITGLFKKNEATDHVRISDVRTNIQHLTTSAWFNVVSNLDSIQQIFEKLREQMKVEQFYDEVQDRTKDLDELIAKKQSDVQARVFNIFTFIMSPLNLVLGFVGGMGLATFKNYKSPVPFLDVEGDITVFLIYFIFWSLIFGLVWVIYKYMSAKE